jgi:PAS domain S-box-containing protein
VRDLGSLAIFAAAFLAAYGNAISLSPHAGSPFYLPDSVLLCALLLTRTRVWWAFIVAVLPIRLLVVTPGLPMWFVLLAFANDSLKGLAAAYLTRRAIPSGAVRFEALRDLWRYWLIAVLLVPALSGVGGAAAWSALGRGFWPVWRQWFLGDALANLILTPLLLYIAQNIRTLTAVRPSRLFEGLVLFSLLPAAAQYSFRHGLGDAGLIDFFSYIPVPFLIWAAVRFGPAGASAALTMMSVLAVFAVGANQAGVPEPRWMDSTLSVQLFMALLAVPILSLAVLVERQRRTEESLRETEKRFRHMADSAPVMIWISGPDGQTTFFNKVWLDFTGRTLEQALDYGWQADVHPEDMDESAAIWSVALHRRQSFHTECRLRRADGEYRWILSSGAPRFTAGGDLAGYIASCIDITDLKRAREEALARQKLESLGVLTNGIAHDFNNLLGGIVALAESAIEELAPGAEAREDVQRIVRVAGRGAEIVRQLMIYSGQDKPKLDLLDLSRLIEETMALLKVSISKRAALRTDLCPDLPLVKGSASQLRQVVMNLIVNASEAIGDSDGAIHITTSRVSAGNGNYSKGPAGLPRGNFLRLAVSDTGCGMSAAERARIFDPFYSTKFAGRGMGLAVVQRVVRDHGGAVHLTSSPGQGTIFEVFLPCAAAVSEPEPGTFGENGGVFAARSPRSSGMASH